MKILVKVKLKKQQEKIEKINDKYFEISIKAIPVKGKANEKIIKILADHLNISYSRIKIISGLKSKEKILEIN